MPIVTEKLTPPTLRSQVATRIRDAICRGSFAPGEKIVGRELASQFGTSLTVIREAIIQLEAEGLIVKRQNASTAIVQLTTRDILDIFAVRRELERYAVVEAARLITDDECRELHGLHRAMELTSSADEVEYIQADFAWHQAVWRCTKNRYLESALERACVPLFGFALAQVPRATGRDLVGDARMHGELMESIVGRDPLQAEKVFATVFEIWVDATLSVYGDTLK